MSHTITPEFSYKCYNDCCDAGCPGHKLKIDYSNTSGTVAVVIDEKAEYYFDPEAIEAVYKAWGHYKDML